MADVQINEVHTDLEITEGAGVLGPAEMKKMLATVMEHLRAHKDHEERCRNDDAVTDHAYSPRSDE
jgi:hypothetical protein